MDFASNQKPQIEEMLKAIGITRVEELFRDVPAHLLLPPPTEDDGISEYEGLRLMQALAAKNTFGRYDSYLGAGAYEHHIPALVGAVCSKSEFLTSYTPYQAEASQGMLQATFEFQSAICALTGMDVANASVYDGASACAEAILMTLRIHPDRHKILIAGSLHPHYRSVVAQYLDLRETQILDIPWTERGQLDLSQIDKLLDSQVAGILVQSPNYFGVMEDLKDLIPKIKAAGAISILCANPLAYGLYASPHELGVDIAVGDCQPFGIPLQFGGPYAGYMACRQEFLRQLPGRIVGETVDLQGRRGFVLTLQAREQHIRREKATSNICTNQALAALASLISMLWYGKEGIQKLALTNFQRAMYLKENLEKIPGISTLGDAPIFNEFIIRLSKPVEEVQRYFREQGIEPGVPLNAFFPNSLLVAVTETKDKQQLDRYLKVAKEAVST